MLTSMAENELNNNKKAWRDNHKQNVEDGVAQKPTFGYRKRLVPGWLLDRAGNPTLVNGVKVPRVKKSLVPNEWPTGLFNGRPMPRWWWSARIVELRAQKWSWNRIAECLFKTRVGGRSRHACATALRSWAGSPGKEPSAAGLPARGSCWAKSSGRPTTTRKTKSRVSSPASRLARHSSTCWHTRRWSPRRVADRAHRQELPDTQPGERNVNYRRRIPARRGRRAAPPASTASRRCAKRSTSRRRAEAPDRTEANAGRQPQGRAVRLYPR